ncbi:hypothetical protein N9C19_00825 [bacterium]|nr:hypothetical protein [bacterium]
MIKLKLFVSMFLLLLCVVSCADATECECQEELDRLLTETARSGNTDVSALAKECDRLYPNVSYIDAECD